MNMDIIRINGKTMTFHPEEPLVIRPDGSFILRVKKRKEKKNAWGWRTFYITMTYPVPAKRMTNIEFDGVSYTCKNMPMSEVVKLRAHIETMLTLDNLNQ
jgi:hypothetical protein